MSVAPRGVCLLLVLFMWVVTVLTVAPCDQKIIDSLKTANQCYRNKVAPSQELPRTKYTHLVTSDIDLPRGTPEEGPADCMRSQRTDDKTFTIKYDFAHIGKTHTNYGASRFSRGKQIRQVEESFEHKIDGDHILETDKNGNTYKLYVFLNEANIYSYYRCIDSGTWQGNGRPEFQVAMDMETANMVKTRKNFRIINAADSMRDKSMACIRQLGIKNNVVMLYPCVV